MSNCEARECNSQADYQCLCSRQIKLCEFHYDDHYNSCRRGLKILLPKRNSINHHIFNHKPNNINNIPNLGENIKKNYQFNEEIKNPQEIIPITSALLSNQESMIKSEKIQKQSTVKTVREFNNLSLLEKKTYVDQLKLNLHHQYYIDCAEIKMSNNN